MTNPVTPNIGLNKIDRTSPATTYFDLEKYIDQNAETVDRFAGEANQAIDALQQRLDTEARREVVLQPGLQIVNAERSAPFSLSGIKGRTLVNLAGRQTFRTSSHVDTMLSVSPGTGSNTDSINVTVPNTSEGYIVYKPAGSKSFEVSAGKYYVISADVKINSISGSGEIKVGGASSVGAYSADKTKIGVWQRVYHKFTKSADQTFDIIVGVCYSGGVFAAANFDVKNVSFYEVSQSDYDGLGALSPEQIVMEYPYVDSIQPVRNPYAIRYGENLLPPFYEWTGKGEAQVSEPYSITLNGITNAVVSRAYIIKVLPNTLYTYSAEHDGYISVTTPSGDVLVDNTQAQSVTFNSGEYNEVIVNIYNNKQAGTFNFKNPMLTIGSKVKPFKPREDSMLALQTNLYADPVTGANADEVFEKDGQYYKLAKWKEVFLDGSYNWQMDVTFPGLKRLKIVTNNPTLDGSEFFTQTYSTKFDGKVLDTRSTGPTKPDQILRNPTNKILYVTVSNTDSGWGDNYTPTADEIKAYFMGWKMYDASTNSDGTGVFNGNGLKSWVRISSWSWAGNMYTDGGYGSVPRSQAKDYTPYQLIYQLAVPTVEPIVSEGMLTFNEGHNQVKVGTGIVLRESAKPYQDGNGWWNLGNPVAISGVSRSFRYKARDVLKVYQNGLEDPRWIDVPTDKYGNIAQLYPMYSADQSSTYSVTYLMMDLSPIVPFTGSYASKEKAMLQELTEVVQQNTTAVSVLMNKKADKDTPVWITPTLLNGWVGFNQNGYTTARFFKDSMGYVHIDGLIKGGSVVAGTAVFVLPVGYRPSQVLSSASMSASTDEVTTSLTRIRVGTDGQVQLSSGALSGFVVLNIPPFLAEQ